MRAGYQLALLLTLAGCVFFLGLGRLPLTGAWLAVVYRRLDPAPRFSPLRLLGRKHSSIHNRTPPPQRERPLLRTCLPGRILSLERERDSRPLETPQSVETRPKLQLRWRSLPSRMG